MAEQLKKLAKEEETTSQALIKQLSMRVAALAKTDYRISDLDAAGATKYYGFLSIGGSWMILKLTATEGRYCKGSSDYATNWTGRTGLTYTLYSAT